jgi:hypothetical protein
LATISEGNNKYQAGGRIFGMTKIKQALGGDAAYL